MNKNFNLKRSFFVSSLLLSLMFSLSVFGQSKNAQISFLITPTSVGEISIGMTIAEARKIFKKATFTQYNYSEEGIWVEVKQGEKNLMRFTTDQKDIDEGDDEGKVAIDESAKIESIEFDDPQYKTADGIHVGSSVSDAEKKFGKITKIELWEYDGSEHADFANAPKNYSFTISPKKGSTEETRAGIYGKDEYQTTKYSSGAYISSIRISKPESSETSNNGDALKFEDYPAEEYCTGRNSSLILDDFGYTYRTRLRDAISNGKPTFAGKYIVASWGCGSGGCNTGGIIDAKTGRAYPFPVSLSSVIQNNSEGEAIDDFQEHKYQLNSRLMMFAGNLEGSDHTDGSDVIEYYEFKDGKFIFIKSMPYGKSK